MKRKIVAILLALSVCVSLAGCGGQSASGETDSVAVSEAKEEQVQKSAEESKNEEPEGKPFDNDERYNFAFDRKVGVLIKSTDPYDSAWVCSGSEGAYERDGYAGFVDNADPHRSYYLFQGVCDGEYLIHGENGLEEVKREIEGYEDALPEITETLDYWDDEIATYDFRFAWDFEFEIDSQEEITVNDYEMCKYNGCVVFQTNELDESKNDVAKRSMTLHITKVRDGYSYFMLLCTDEHSEETAEIVEYFADKAAQTFCVHNGR